MTVITTNSEYITIEEASELITTHRYKTTGRYSVWRIISLVNTIF